MPPSLYEWQGISIKFYSNKHEVEGANPLHTKQMKQALRLIKKYRYNIINSWIDFFVLNKSIKLKRIHSKTL